MIQKIGSKFIFKIGARSVPWLDESCHTAQHGGRAAQQAPEERLIKSKLSLSLLTHLSHFQSQKRNKKNENVQVFLVVTCFFFCGSLIPVTFQSPSISL
jgi:hypothetical protein